MNLNIYQVLRYAMGKFSQSLNLVNPSVLDLQRFYGLTLDALTFKVYRTSVVTWS